MSTVTFNMSSLSADKIGRESPSVRVAISISSARTGSKVQGLVCLSDKFDFTHVYLTKRQGMVYVGETKFHFFGGFGIKPDATTRRESAAMDKEVWEVRGCAGSDCWWCLLRSAFASRRIVLEYGFL